MTRSLAPIAFALGLLAIALAAFQNNLDPQSTAKPPAAKERSFRDLAKDTAKRLWQEKVLDEPSHTNPPGTKFRLTPYQMGYTGVGLIAMALGILAWVKRHDHARLAAAAVALGIMAVAWEWTLIGVTIAVIIFILSILG